MPTKTIIKEIKTCGQPKKVKMYQKFFQTAPGQYGEGDVFIAGRVPDMRKIAKKHAKTTSLKDIEALLQHKVHEVRFTALIILTHHFEDGISTESDVIHLYLANTHRMNNWDLVDVTAHKIIGAYTLEKPFPFLSKLAQSNLLWDRRIAVVATWAHSKARNPKPILTLAEQLLADPHPLMHKAIGWMLREMGKRCGLNPLLEFLEENAPVMPRTMLRYAIEKLPKEERKYFLNLKG